MKLLHNPDMSALIWPHLKFHVISVMRKVSSEVDSHLDKEAWTVNMDGDPV